MTCPFLNVLSTSFLNRYSNTILKNYVTYCPSFSRLYSSFINNSNENDAFTDKSEVDSIQEKCPFLLKYKPKLKTLNEETSKEIIQENHTLNKELFQYSKFFKEQILKKKQDHSYRIFKKIARNASNMPFAAETKLKRNKINVWCSNDYLGMSTHPKVKQAIIDAVNNYGSGSGGTRNISGNTPLHEELEHELSSLHKKEAALLFTSCFVANDSSLYTLGKMLPNCQIFSDSGNHASMIQGIRNSGTQKYVFKTCDPIDLELKLKKVNFNLPKIVAFETVHSMTGAISPVGDFCDLAIKYNAMTFVDEVHAVGLYGNTGGGIAERDNLVNKIDIISGTLGKAFGNIGGYIVGNHDLIDMIRSYAAGFIFTTSLPPTVLKGALKSIQILKSEEGQRLRKSHQEIISYMKSKLTEAGLPQLPSVSHIIPIPVDNAKLCTLISNKLLIEYNQYVQSINYPTIPKGEERLRLAPTPFHNKKMIDEFVENLKKVWLDVGLSLHKKRISKSNFTTNFEQLKTNHLIYHENTNLQNENCYFCHRNLGQKSPYNVPCGSNKGCPYLVCTNNSENKLINPF